ncbi:MAG: hypothetical protein QM638_09100 [Nocardioides sp.]|uniref:hypothetical protein n=1 Tax=Nocardioides sp. TaxID=35761 RepID=UPI0039E3593E
MRPRLAERPDRRRRDPRRDDRGSALIEFAWVGIILLVPLIWVVLSVFTAQRGAFATSGAARAAGRAYVLAPTDALGAARARDAARQVFRDQGIGAQSFTVRVSCSPYPHQCHSGTSVVRVRIEARVRLPLLPDLLGGRAGSLRVDATHTLPVGRYQEITGVD